MPIKVIKDTTEKKCTCRFCKSVFTYSDSDLDDTAEYIANRAKDLERIRRGTFRPIANRHYKLTPFRKLKCPCCGHFPVQMLLREDTYQWQDCTEYVDELIEEAHYANKDNKKDV